MTQRPSIWCQYKPDHLHHWKTAHTKILQWILF